MSKLDAKLHSIYTVSCCLATFQGLPLNKNRSIFIILSMPVTIPSISFAVTAIKGNWYIEGEIQQILL